MLSNIKNLKIMITVDDVLKEGKTANSNVEKQSSELKPQTKSYWPWILLASAAAAVGIWLYKKGQTNGDIPV